MSDIDQQFIEYVVKSLVGKPDAVHIDRSVDEKGVLLELTVDPEDLGRVIGKRGATAQSLRTLLRALGTKNEARYNLKIIDNGEAPVKSGDDQPTRDDKPAPKREEKPAAPAEEAHEEQAEKSPEPVAEPEAAVVEDDQVSDRLASARAELADLDDLDI